MGQAEISKINYIEAVKDALVIYGLSLVLGVFVFSIAFIGISKLISTNFLLKAYVSFLFILSISLPIVYLKIKQRHILQAGFGIALFALFSGFMNLIIFYLRYGGLKLEKIFNLYDLQRILDIFVINPNNMLGNLNATLCSDFGMGVPCILVFGDSLILGSILFSVLAFLITFGFYLLINRFFQRPKAS